MLLDVKAKRNGTFYDFFDWNFSRSYIFLWKTIPGTFPYSSLKTCSRLTPSHVLYYTSRTELLMKTCKTEQTQWLQIVNTHTVKTGKWIDKAQGLLLFTWCSFSVVRSHFGGNKESYKSVCVGLEKGEFLENVYVAHESSILRRKEDNIFDCEWLVCVSVYKNRIKERDGKFVPKKNARNFFLDGFFLAFRTEFLTDGSHSHFLVWM